MKITADIPYSAPDPATGQGLCLDVYGPESQSRPTTVLFAHGGGFARGERKNADARAFAERFTDQGYGFAALSYRLNTPLGDFTQERQDSILAMMTRTKESGLTLNARLYGPAFFAALQDGAAAVRYLRGAGASLGLATQNLVWMGVSAGGILGLSLANPPKGWAGSAARVNGVISIAGALVHPWLLRAKSPPCLMFHGKADRIIPVENARLARRAAKAAGAPLDLVVSPGTGHKDQTTHLRDGQDAKGQPMFTHITKFLEALQ